MMRPVRPGNHKHKHRRGPSRAGNHKGKRNVRLPITLGFVVLVLLAAGIISQMPSALADDSDNPFRALWDAIFDLQSRDEDMQNQIDELRAGREALLPTQEPEFVSDLYAEIEIEASEDGRTLVYVTAGNSGPDRAAAVKVTAFYLMPLFEINSINGHQCEDKSRGIIECALGTLEEGQESVITIDATSRESGQANAWTVDVSTTTDDTDYANNHVAYDFETGSGELIEIPEVEQPEEEQEESTDDSGGTQAEPEPEQDDSGSDIADTETEASQKISGNQTYSETGEEIVEDSDSNSTSSETEEQAEEQAQEEQSASDESGTDDSARDASEESGSGEESSENEEESGSKDSESSDSSEQESSDSGSEESGEGGSESGDGGESPSQ